MMWYDIPFILLGLRVPNCVLSLLQSFANRSNHYLWVFCLIRRVGIWLPAFLISVLDGSEWTASGFGRFSCSKLAPLPSSLEVCGQQSCCGCCPERDSFSASTHSTQTTLIVAVSYSTTFLRFNPPPCYLCTFRVQHTKACSTLQTFYCHIPYFWPYFTSLASFGVN